MIIEEGEYIDKKRIKKTFGLRLEEIICDSPTAKIIIVDYKSFEEIKNNTKLLSNNLHNAIYKISPPMDQRSEKAC